VSPRLIFTRLSDGAVRAFDFLVDGAPPVLLSIESGHWLAADPSPGGGGFGLTRVGAGLFVDHDGDPATPSVGPLPGSSDFFPGLRALRCSSGDCAQTPLIMM